MTIQQMLMSTGIASQTYWTNTITNSTGNVTLFGQAFDSEGNIYVCGERDDNSAGNNGYILNLASLPYP